MLTTKKRAKILLIFSVGIGLAAGWQGCVPAGTRALVKGEKLLQQGKYLEAVSKFEEATQAFPNHPKAWNQLGLGYQYAGDAKKAASAYQKALTLDRNLAAARYNLGLLYLEGRNFPAAIGELTTFIQLESKNPDGWLKLGLAQMQYANSVSSADKARQLEASKKNLEWSQKLHPSAQTLNAIGLVQIQRGRPREAVPNFTAALKQDPDYAPALLNLAVVHHQYLNESHLALVNYRQFLLVAKGAPETAKVQMAVRQLEAELKPPAPVTILAQTNVTKPPLLANANQLPLPANANKPPQPAANTNISVAVKSETDAPRLVAAPKIATPLKPAPIVSSPKAQPLARKELKVDVVKLPDETPIKPAEDIPLPIITKPAAVISNNSELAVNPTRRSTPPEKGSGVLTKLNPATWFKKKPKPMTPVTELPTARANSENASVPEQETVSKPRSVEPTPIWPRYKYRFTTKPAEGKRAEADPFFKRGVQAQKNRQTADALEAYRQAMKLDPSFFEASYNFGLVARESTDISGSLSAYEQALAIMPESANARYNFAFALQEAGYFQDASNELQKLLAQSPNETRAHLLLGTLCAQRLNQTSSAREHYLKVLAAEPNHPQATQLRYWVAAHP